MIGGRARRRDERGVSLILVLVTLTIFGLIVPVLGQFGSTNGVSGYVLKGQRFDRYAAEAGMQAAIGWAEGQRQAGRVKTRCPDFTAGGLNADLGPNATRSVKVKCIGFDGNGLPDATASMPAYALMARSSDSRAIRVDGNGSARTDGAWWSEGGIRVDSTTIDATADYVGARGSCSGITASPTDCRSARTEPDPGTVPGSTYQIPVPAVIPVDRPGPSDACDAVRGGVLPLAPGLHWDSDFLDEIGDGKCGTVTVVLADGGPHIFDFQFFGGGRPDWRLVPGRRGNTVRVVSQGFESGCVGSSGPVLFAGSFRMQLGDRATADLCGADGPGQHIAAAQVVSGSDPVDETSAVRTPTRWTVNDRNGSFDFPPSSITTPAGLLAVAECVPDRNCVGGFVRGTLRGDRAEGNVVMTIPDPVPANLGAKVERLHLDITHRERGDVAESHVWIDGAGLPDQFECDLTDPGNRLNPSDNFTTTGYDCDLSDVERPYFPEGDLTLTYQVRLRNRGEREDERSADVALDAVQLSAVFARPTARTSDPRDDILRLDSGGTIRALGTVYLPSGDVRLDFGDGTDSTFERGVVVDSIDVNGLPNAADFTPFSLPGGGNYTDRLTTFEAFLDDETSPVLTARVRFCDGHPEGGNATVPCSGAIGGPAKILAWNPAR